ncbi:fimbrial protein [Candidatus Fukatsuia endosymbiont of Tuberolachnus salignus]|uniref:fimbrial protein n=1 Tax=Candidatus Fukatsuia endosymbiont of Tuberolachnus salignus TaxID=3077957 RepID=UPI00313D979A
MLLGNVLTKYFSGIGRYAADRKFKILLSCDPYSEVRLTLNGKTVNNLSDVLELEPSLHAVVADDVGIQILHEGNPMMLRRRIEVPDGAISEEIKIPCVARYVQTKNVIKGGQANSHVTFTVHYN